MVSWMGVNENMIIIELIIFLKILVFILVDIYVDN